MADEVAAHAQVVSHRYVVHYPAHPPRASDPHYKDFNHFHQTTKANARCAMAIHATLDGDAEATRQEATPHRLIGPGELRNGCDTENPLETHHAVIEFSLQNGVDLAILEKDYPGVSNPDELGAWVESATNLEWLCVHCHRGPSGKHTAAYADFEAAKYVHGLIDRAS